MIMMLVLDLPPFDFPPPQQIRFILQTTFLSRLCDTHPFGTSLNLLELDEVGETTVVTTYCLIVFFIFAVIVDTRGLRTFFVGGGGAMANSEKERDNIAGHDLTTHQTAARCSTSLVLSSEDCRRRRIRRTMRLRRRPSPTRPRTETRLLPRCCRTTYPPRRGPLGGWRLGGRRLLLRCRDIFAWSWCIRGVDGTILLLVFVLVAACF